MRTLFVESSKSQQLFFQDIFYECGADVVPALSGREALKIIEENLNFDLICSSVVLSDMSGPEVCSLIRANPSTFTIPIIMVTTGSAEVVSHCLASGATDVFGKDDSESLRGYIKSYSRYLRNRTNKETKALYVEDSRSQAAQVMKWLEDIPISCDHFESAEEAYKAYQHTQYDLLITDVLLKGRISGLRLVRHIREDHQDHQLPILVISGFSDVSRAMEVYRAGANDYVSKPQVKYELIARVDHLLAKSCATKS